MTEALNPQISANSPSGNAKNYISTADFLSYAVEIRLSTCQWSIVAAYPCREMADIHLAQHEARSRIAARVVPV